MASAVEDRLTAALGGLATPPILRTMFQLALRLIRSNDAHIQGPRREEKGVSSRLCTNLGQLLEVEKLADRHPPQTATM